MNKRIDKYKVAIICKILLVSTSFAVSIFVNRGLGVDSKGAYAYVIHFVEILCVLFSFGIGQTYSIFKKMYNERYKSVFISLGFVHGLLILLIGSLLIIFYNLEYLGLIVLLTSLSVVKFIISMIAVIEDSICRNILLTKINVVYFVEVWVAYYFCANVNVYLFLYGINDLIFIIWIIRNYKMSLGFNGVTKSIVLSIYKKGALTMVVMLLISINYSIDVLMLKHMSSSYYTGLYSVAVTFSNMFLLIPDSFKEVLFGDSIRNDFSKSIAYNSIKVSFLFSFFILIGFILFGKWAIKVFYGEEFVDSYSLTLILFTGSLSMIFFKILQPIYISHGKQLKAAIYLACSAIVNIILNLYLIPLYNASGASIASAISYTVCGGLFLLNYRNDH